MKTATTQPTDLIGILCEGTMKAAIEIASRKGFLNNLDAAKMSEALRRELANGYDTAAKDAKDALDTVGSAWAQKSLNLSCIEFAMRALRSCGYLPDSESQAVN